MKGKNHKTVFDVHYCFLIILDYAARNEIIVHAIDVQFSFSTPPISHGAFSILFSASGILTRRATLDGAHIRSGPLRHWNNISHANWQQLTLCPILYNKINHSSVAVYFRKSLDSFYSSVNIIKTIVIFYNYFY